ncbi:FeoB-associated Cys-rich membrane protein [Blastopirellula marina]|uniref:FeoB-associated Cys-rich membrane protein n=1 Tax=Blastopirellula marina TaxID=124 RepID=A0A2S8GC65_9BACT|nr:FeoB-associated Cys-rich membrane protein [Blastopirellula marina]PQO42019.1 hypothetical protein C5Y93_27050 [Blastopirellula marina]
MWQNWIVLAIVAVAVSYVVWTIYRGIAKAAESAGGSCGGGCGSCGCKSSGGGNLVQLSGEPLSTEQQPDEATASEERESAVSSH